VSVEWPPAVQAAARHFGTDLDSEFWRSVLLCIMAQALFGNPKKRGRGRPSKASKWSATELIKLGGEAQKYLHLSDRKAAELIARELKAQSAEVIRRALPKAREWWLSENYNDHD
jgi:hypothetical protein